MKLQPHLTMQMACHIALPINLSKNTKIKLQIVNLTVGAPKEETFITSKGIELKTRGWNQRKIPFQTSCIF